MNSYAYGFYLKYETKDPGVQASESFLNNVKGDITYENEESYIW